MVKNFTNVAPVEVEVAVAEVYKRDASDEDDHPGVVSLTRWLKRIIADLVTIRQVMNVVLLFPGVTTSVAGEVVIVTAQMKVNREVSHHDHRSLNLATYLIKGRSF